MVDALRKGLISRISIEGGEHSIKIYINKKSSNALNIEILVGVTTFGFISAKRIRTAGSGVTATRSKKEIIVEFASYVGTDDFTGDGFSIEINKPLLIAIPADKEMGEVSGDGNLKVDVPSGYSMFALDGVSGNIISGRISIEENRFASNKDAAKYSICFGNMRVTE